MQAGLIVIGNGPPDQIPEFAQYTGFKGTVLTDPDLVGYKTLGFLRTVSGILSAKAMLGGLKALKAGHRQGGVQGDALQLGGAVVIGPGPKLYYYYRSTNASDHPPVTQILRACSPDKVPVD